MRTKVLLSLAAFAVSAFAAYAQANNVYSVNIVGYVNQTYTNAGSTTKFYMIANPLSNGSNDLDTVLGTFPPDSVVTKWDGSGFETDPATYFDGFGWFPNNTLAPGQGAFLQLPANSGVNVTYVGEVKIGSFTNTFNPGFTIAGNQVPKGGTLTELGIPGVADEVVTRWDVSAQAYESDPGTYFDGFGWFPDNTVQVAEGFFFENKQVGALNWTQSLTNAP